MHFKIITTGSNCGDVFKDTLSSIERQRNRHYEVCVVDDGSGDEQQNAIREWCESRDERWQCIFHGQSRGTTRNEYEGIRSMNPTDEDVIISLDLNGERFANPDILDRLVHHYTDDLLMIYASGLRTAKWKLLKMIPDRHFRNANGTWMLHADAFYAARELAGEHYKTVTETLLLPGPSRVS